MRLSIPYIYSVLQFFWGYLPSLKASCPLEIPPQFQWNPTHAILTPYSLSSESTLKPNQRWFKHLIKKALGKSSTTKMLKTPNIGWINLCKLQLRHIKQCIFLQTTLVLFVCFLLYHSSVATWVVRVSIYHQHNPLKLHTSLPSLQGTYDSCPILPGTFIPGTFIPGKMVFVCSSQCHT